MPSTSEDEVPLKADASPSGDGMYYEGEGHMPLRHDSSSAPPRMDGRYYHSLPSNPTCMDYVLLYPLALTKYFKRLVATFGAKYVLIGTVPGSPGGGVRRAACLAADRHARNTNPPAYTAPAA